MTIRAVVAAFVRQGLWALMLMSCVAFPWSHAVASPKGSPWNEQYFTNLPVVDQFGKTHRFYDDLIRDKIVIVNFIFTNCETVCPLMTSRLREVKERLGDRIGKDIFIYSITVDPERDTPQVMKTFFDPFEPGDGWLFLTGKPEDLKLIRYKLGERARSLSEHRSEAALGNDRTGEWTKLSAFEDYDQAARIVLAMDPAWRAAQTTPVTYTQAPEYGSLGLRGQALFIKGCASCHTIGGGDKVGPDLHRVGERRDPAWLMRFIMRPDAMRAEKDPLAMELTAQYKGVRMPNIGLAMNDVHDLMSYLEAKSASLDAEAIKRAENVPVGGAAHVEGHAHMHATP
jgi:protein SCO1